MFDDVPQAEGSALLVTGAWVAHAVAFGVLARDTLLADAVSKIAADPDVPEDDGQDLDARQALASMRQTLDDP